MSFSTKQLETAAIITRVGRDVGASEAQIVTAIATAYQESTLGLNLSGDNGQGWGIFQQHPASGWGSKDYVLDPYNAARSFFVGHGSGNPGLLDTWGTRATHGLDAQAVQRSAYPDAYDAQLPVARQVWNKLAQIAGGKPVPYDPTAGNTSAGASSGSGVSVNPVAGQATPAQAEAIKQIFDASKYKPNPAVARVVVLGVGLVLILLAAMRYSGGDAGESLAPSKIFSKGATSGSQ
jgi:hypothetical protein